LSRVAELAEDVTAEAGAVLMEQGKVGQECYIVIDGTADVVIGGDTVAQLGPGEPIGEMALIDNRPRSATVKAKTQMQLLALDTKRFQTLLDEMPKANRAIMAKLSERLRNVDLA
jgi:CRP-like cAMP-binding protein